MPLVKNIPNTRENRRLKFKVYELNMKPRKLKQGWSIDKDKNGKITLTKKDQ